MRDEPASGAVGGGDRSLHDLLRFERLLSDLSAMFIGVPVDQIDRAIEDSLQRIVSALGIDRSTLSRVFPLTGLIETTHSFGVEGVEPVARSLPAREHAPWALAMATARRPIVFSRLDDLPPEASLDKQTFRALGLKSHVTMPIVVAGRLYGGLSFGCVRFERSWPDELLGRMRLLAEVFGSALARKLAQDELDLAIGFERLASSILASLVMATPADAGQAIEAGLAQIGRFLGAEQISIWQQFGGDAQFAVMQRWQAAGLDPASTGPDTVTGLPWIRGRVAAGHAVRMARATELPPEAQIDAIALHAFGIRSLLVLPIMVSGVIAGALSIASVERENEWPEALTPGVKLLAEVFGSVHAREATERRRQAAEIEAAHWRERLAHIVRVHTAGEMSVALAHEITQPLGAIENYALAARRRASDETPDLSRVVELLDKVIGQATRAGDVVTRMRSMAQRHEIQPKPLDVRAAVLGCVSMVKMDCDLRDIRLTILPSRPLPIVVADEIHFQQVALNLLRNAMEAIEFARPGSPREITLSIEANERDEVVVSIADTGGGIAEGDLERVFESFYSTKSSGLGVGLAICRKLIEAHGGALWASHNPEGGATFRFTLPVAMPEPPHVRGAE